MTSKFETRCPLENDGDKIELEFPFSAPNLPSAVSTTKFRWMFLSLPVLSICVVNRTMFAQVQQLQPSTLVTTLKILGWRLIIFRRPSPSWLPSFQKNVSGSLDWRRLPRVANQFWNQASTTRWVEDEKTANLQSFAHLLVCWVHMIIVRREKAADWKKFCTFSWFVVSTWSEFDLNDSNLTLQVTTTSDLDMICIMYPTIITK